MKHIIEPSVIPFQHQFSLCLGFTTSSLHLKSKTKIVQNDFQSILSIFTLYIWATCFRTDIPLKVCRWLPQNLCSLTPHTLLIYNPFGLGTASFFYLWVLSRILHTQNSLGWQNVYFCELGAHATNLEPYNDPFWDFRYGARQKERKIPKIIN